MVGKSWFRILLLASVLLTCVGQTVLADDPASVLGLGRRLPVVRFRGAVESRPEDTTLGIWVIDGKRVSVVETTVLDESQGPALVGAQVEVVARRLAVATATAVDLEAILIRVLRAVETPRPFVIRGFVTELETTYLVVNGLTILYDRSTQIIGRLAVGALVRVVAYRVPEGIKARSIQVLPQTSRVIHFQGTIESIGTDSWVVGGRKVKVDAQTVILGTPKVGLRARVWALVLPNRELLALVIQVQDEPQLVEWTGPIEYLPPTIAIYPPVWVGRWVVGGQAVWVTRETEIVGTPRIGALAHVQAYRQGAPYREAARPLVAKKIEILHATD